MFSSLLNLRVNLSFSLFIWLPEYLLASPPIPVMFFLNLFSRSFIWESQISVIGPLLSSIYIHSFGDFIQLDHFLKCHILDNSHVFRARTPPWTSASHSDALMSSRHLKLNVSEKNSYTYPLPLICGTHTLSSQFKATRIHPFSCLGPNAYSYPWLLSLITHI